MYEIRVELGRGAPGPLVTSGDVVRLHPQDVDAVEFERRGASTDLADLIKAESLYRGPLLDGFEAGAAGFDTWAATERERFRDMARRVLESVVIGHLEGHDGEAALRAARRLSGLDPFGEAGHRLTMRALAACGRRNEALTYYDSLERKFREELSVAPDAETRAVRDSFKRPAGAVAATPMSGPGEPLLAEDDKPAIAILPFKNISGDIALDTLARAMTEDLATALCRMPDFLTIALDSLQDLQRQQVPAQTAKELGVRYVIVGSTQKCGDALRISAQLIDTSTGISLWGDRFDRPARARFALQDEIVANILVALQIKVGNGDLAQVHGRRSVRLEAWLRLTQAISQSLIQSREATLRARELALAARDLDATWDAPWGTLAWSYWWEAKRGWATRRESAIKKGVECAEEAIEVNSRSPSGYTCLGNLARLAGDHDRAADLIERAVRHGPNHFGALWNLGRVHVSNGNLERGLAAYRRAVSLGSRTPTPLLSGLIHTELAAGNVDTAVDLARRITKRKHSNPFNLISVTASFAAAGQFAEAQDTVAELLRIDQTCTISAWRAYLDYREPAAIDRLTGFLERAGLPS